MSALHTRSGYRPECGRSRAELREERRAAVAALLSVEATPGVGAYSPARVAELLGLSQHTISLDAVFVSRRVPPFERRIARSGTHYTTPIWARRSR